MDIKKLKRRFKLYLERDSLTDEDSDDNEVQSENKNLQLIDETFDWSKSWETLPLLLKFLILLTTLKALSMTRR
jgi:hypothetical protein